MRMKPAVLVEKWRSTQIPEDLMDLSGDALWRYSGPRAQLLLRTRGWNDTMASDFRDACLARTRDHAAEALDADSLDYHATSVREARDLSSLFDAARAAWADAEEKGAQASRANREQRERSDVLLRDVEATVPTESEEQLAEQAVSLRQGFDTLFEIQLSQNIAYLAGGAALSVKALVCATVFVVGNDKSATVPAIVAQALNRPMSPTEVATEVAACAAYARLQAGAAIDFAKRAADSRIGRADPRRRDLDELAWQADWLADRLR